MRDKRMITNHGIRYQGKWYVHPTFRYWAGTEVKVRLEGPTLVVDVDTMGSTVHYFATEEVKA